MPGSFGSSQFSRPPMPFSIAGPNKVGVKGAKGDTGATGAAGANGTNGTNFTQSVTVLPGITNGVTVTLSPAIGQDVVLPMPAGGGTVTINVGTVAARQRVLLDIINGATLGTVVFGTGFLAGSTSPAYGGAAINTTDNITFIATGTTAGNVNSLRIEALNLGFAS